MNVWLSAWLVHGWVYSFLAVESQKCIVCIVFANITHRYKKIHLAYGFYQKQPIVAKTIHTIHFWEFPGAKFCILTG